jgi:hypothetical protein
MTQGFTNEEKHEWMRTWMIAENFQSSTKFKDAYLGVHHPVYTLDSLLVWWGQYVKADSEGRALFDTQGNCANLGEWVRTNDREMKAKAKLGKFMEHLREAMKEEKR